MPEDRYADCVRFALSKDEGTKIVLQYVYEREHEPIRHGVVEYDCVAHAWTVFSLDDVVRAAAGGVLSGGISGKTASRTRFLPPAS